MGVDYYVSKYVGFKVNKSYYNNAEIAAFIRRHVSDGLLTSFEDYEDYLSFESHEITLASGRLNQFIETNRITGGIIYPKKYFKKLTREQFGGNVTFTDREVEFMIKMKEYDPNFELSYFKVARTI